jgi:anti-sigma regulatory factor (Ser/Thr protein kinase)
VKATIDSNAVQIRVVDTGLGFDPTSVADADLDSLIRQRKSGGLGMRLIKSLMDEVHYEIVPGQKNELAMTKLRKKE